jgi:hypothetical protein
MKKALLGLLTVGILASWASGCAMTMHQEKTEFDSSKARNIVIGKSTKKDVEALLGPANQQSLMGDIESWSYNNMDAIQYKPLAMFTGINDKGGWQSLSIQFRNNIVSDCVFSTSSVATTGYAFTGIKTDSKHIQRKCSDVE